MNGSLSETTTTLDVMLRQEDVYHISHLNKNVDQATLNHLVTALENIQELCRLRHRETLVIAVSYLVRYLHSQAQPQHEGEDLSCIALVCFYLACKIHEPAALPVSTLTDLHQRFLNGTSSSSSSSVHWEQLELQVCSTLRWRLHPPMPLAFCDQFLSTTLLLLKGEPKKLRKRAQACLEAAFRAHPIPFLQDHKASSLATAALFLAQRRDHWTCCSSGGGALFPTTTSAKEITMALCFLQAFASSSSPSSQKKHRKRAPSEPQERPRKKSKQSTTSTTTTLSPCMISTRSPCLQPPTRPCWIWTPSPLTMAE